MSDAKLAGMYMPKLRFPWNQTHLSCVTTSKRLGGRVLVQRRNVMKRIGMQRSLFLVPILTLFVFWSASLTARADAWSKTYTPTGHPDLRVETSDANIHVSTWDQNTIEAKVSTTHYKIGDDGIRIEEHQTGNVVEIDV